MKENTVVKVNLQKKSNTPITNYIEKMTREQFQKKTRRNIRSVQKCILVRKISADMNFNVKRII